MPKVVQIDAEHRQRLIAAQRPAHALLEAILQHLTVAGTGQRVVAGGAVQRAAQAVALHRVLAAADDFAGGGLIPQGVVEAVADAGKVGLVGQVNNRHAAVVQHGQAV